ncbi:MAG: DNA primase, partial [Bacteroides sp.]
MEFRDFAKFGIDTRGRSAGRLKTYCEECRSTRKNKRDKSLYVNLDTGWCHCYHCGHRFYVPTVQEEREKEERRERSVRSVPQHFQRPVFDASKLTLSEEVERYLVEKRCISQKTIAGMRITEQTTVMPQTGKAERCICFNYFEEGQLVNTKFRT